MQIDTLAHQCQINPRRSTSFHRCRTNLAALSTPTASTSRIRRLVRLLRSITPSRPAATASCLNRVDDSSPTGQQNGTTRVRPAASSSQSAAAESLSSTAVENLETCSFAPGRRFGVSRFQFIRIRERAPNEITPFHGSRFEILPPDVRYCRSSDLKRYTFSNIFLRRLPFESTLSYIFAAYCMKRLMSFRPRSPSPFPSPS